MAKKKEQTILEVSELTEELQALILESVESQAGALALDDELKKTGSIILGGYKVSAELINQFLTDMVNDAVITHFTAHGDALPFILANPSGMTELPTGTVVPNELVIELMNIQAPPPKTEKLKEPSKAQKAAAEADTEANCNVCNNSVSFGTAKTPAV